MIQLSDEQLNNLGKEALIVIASSLQDQLLALQSQLDHANAQLSHNNRQIELLTEQIRIMNQRFFGRKSEASVSEVDGQISLFDSFNEVKYLNQNSSKEPEITEVIIPSYHRKKSVGKRDADLSGLPARIIEHTLSAEELATSFPDGYKELPEEVYKRLHIIPETFIVDEHHVHVYASKSNDGTILKAPRPKDLFRNSIATPALVASIINGKYTNALPLERQAKTFKTNGIQLSTNTMANWVIRNSEAFFLPMYEYFHRKLLERGFAMADETPLQVLHEPERRAQTKSYMWLFRSGEDGGPPIIIYKYSETRAGDNAVDFLHGFKGYLMCDGYSGYNKVPDVKRTACWAHIRRYLTDAIPKGKALDYTQPSVQGMLYINQLFHLEDVIRSKYSSFDAIKKARLEKEKPVVEGFLSWLDQQSPTRGSRMDKAVTYIQNRRSYLSTYLEDGRCSFSNNLSENAIRPFTVGRKNWLFCDTPNGAQASAIVYTMVEMAKANGVNVYHYLTYLLEKLPDDRMSDDELELLAPWNETVKAEIERRANESNQTYVNCQGAPTTEK